jgi:hypothetical protein
VQQLLPLAALQPRRQLHQQPPPAQKPVAVLGAGPVGAPPRLPLAAGHLLLAAPDLNQHPQSLLTHPLLALLQRLAKRQLALAAA